MTLCSCLSIMVAQLLPFTTAIDLFLDPAPLSLATVDSSFSADLNDCTVSICSVWGVPVKTRQFDYEIITECMLLSSPCICLQVCSPVYLM